MELQSTKQSGTLGARKDTVIVYTRFSKAKSICQVDNATRDTQTLCVNRVNPSKPPAVARTSLAPELAVGQWRALLLESVW